MKVAIYGRSFRKKHKAFVLELLQELDQRGISYVMYEPFYRHLIKMTQSSAKIETFNGHDDIRSRVDYIFSLGGDGTILDTLTLARNSNIPIMGINLGRLGFLASIATDELDTALTALERGTYGVDSRPLIQLESNKPMFGNVPFAMNEFTIQRKDTSSMITIHTYINGELLNSYWADGLIVATPTGSTGYSLSCGGPIIDPTCKNFVITPVAPHNLYVRPIVVSSDVVISFEVEGRGNEFLCTLDSRNESINKSFQLAVKTADFNVNLIRLNDTSFLNAIREKLMWGLDQRN